MAGASTRSDKMVASNAMDSALSRLLVINEAYPQLKSDANYARLMDELAGTENRLAVERKRYNDAVAQYNTDVRGIPGAWWAKMGGFPNQKEYFKESPGSQAVPKVSFAPAAPAAR
jgi:LemA protein